MISRHNPHPCLDPLVRKIEADGVGLLGIAYAHSFARITPKWLGPLRRVAEYIELAWRIRKQSKKNHIIVREFSTYFIFITVPLIFSLRHKCILLIAHNVQRAESNRLQKALLKILSSLRFRFACLETGAGVENVLGLKGHLVFRLPTAILPSDRTLSKDCLTVGIVGDMRPEKGFGNLMVDIQKEIAKRPLWRFQVGSNRPDFVRKLWPSVGVKDTTTIDDYNAFLTSLDVLIAPYPEENYRYRVSGVIAEAVGAGCVIVCTDTPAFRQQVLTPEKAGICVSDAANMAVEIGTALDAITCQLPVYRKAATRNATVRHEDAVFSEILQALSHEVRNK